MQADCGVEFVEKVWRHAPGNRPDAFNTDRSDLLVGTTSLLLTRLGG